MEMRRRQPIGVELVRRGIVTEEDIQKALEIQRSKPNKRLGDILYTLNICDPEILIQTVGEILGEKGIILKPSDINIKPTDYISYDIIKASKAIPFELESGKIKVCFAETTNRRNIEGSIWIIQQSFYISRITGIMTGLKRRRSGICPEQ